MDLISYVYLMLEDENLRESEATIFVKRPWKKGSSIYIEESEVDDATELRDGCEYFIEVNLAHEFLQDYIEANPSASLKSSCDRLIYYAEFDA